MPIGDWIDFPTIKAVSKHTSGVATAIVAFLIIGALIERGLNPGTLKTILVFVDGSILVGCLLMLGWKLFNVLLREEPPHFFLAA